MNTGTTPVRSREGLLTTLAWKVGGTTTYALEGSVFIAGAAIQWLRDGLGLVTRAPESEALARTVPDTGGVYFVPAFVGLGAPYWDMYARGTVERGANLHARHGREPARGAVRRMATRGRPRARMGAMKQSTARGRGSRSPR